MPPATAAHRRSDNRRDRRLLKTLRTFDQPVLVCEHDDLHAVAELELGEDPPDVGLDRRFGQQQPLGDLGVVEAPRDYSMTSFSRADNFRRFAGSGGSRDSGVGSRWA